MPSAHPSPPLALRTIRTAAELPEDWERLRSADQVALAPGFLRAFERAAIPGVSVRYVLGFRGGILAAGAAVYRVSIQLDEVRFPWSADLCRQARDLGRPDLLRFSGLMCGLNVSQGRDDIVSGDTPPDDDFVLALAEHLERAAEEQELDGVIFAHLHPGRLAPFRRLLHHDYLMLPSLPYASLDVRWSSLSTYLSALRSGYRRQAQANLRNRERTGLEVCFDLDLGAAATELTPLYQAVVARAEQRIEVLNAEFFRALAHEVPGSSLVGLRRDGRLVAGAVVVATDHRLTCLEVGLDDEERGEADLYHNLLLALVERACQRGARHLDFGQTALAAKTRIGADVVPTWLLVKPRSPLVAAALRVERTHLRAAELPFARRVFRESSGKDDGADETRAEPAAVAAVHRGGDDDRAGIDGGDYARHVNPDLAALLGVLGLDRTYVRGDGVRLWDREGREVLDFTSGYGALPFGHNPAFAWDALARLRERSAPLMTQGSLSAEAGALGSALCRLAPPGLRYAVLANSGAESVEIAIKAARARTRRPGIVVAAGAFHGKTLGALSATPSKFYQEPFFAPAPGFLTVPYGDAEAIERLLAARSSEIAGVLLEPILGEGGIVVPPAGYLRAVRASCTRHGVLLLLDEVQTGLGRAGRLFACEEEGITPDVLTVSKGLGGGLVPVGACLLADSAWSEALAMRHSSTFAGNAVASAVALAVLDRLTGDGGALLAEVRRKGDALRARLAALAARNPALAEVRGRGLMVGLELGSLDGSTSPILRHLARERNLAPLACSYLLARHGIRVMPPLARRTTLRLIAPLDVPDAALDRVAAALEDVFDRIAAGDIRALALPLVSPPTPRGWHRMSGAAVAAPAPATPRIEVAPPARLSALETATPSGRFAFVLHPLDVGHYRELEPSLDASDDRKAAAFGRLLRDLVDAVEISHVHLRSATGATCEGWFIGLPFTTRSLVRLRPHELQRWMRSAVELARDRGADVLGLGAFTSVVTGGGVGLTEEGIGITTGGAYTVATALLALDVAAREMDIDSARATCAVVGASGSIGRVCSLLLARRARRLILVGNPASSDANERLAALAAEIRANSPEPPEIECTVDARRAVPEAELVVSTTSAVGALLQPEWLRRGAVICDVAKPSDVSSEVSRRRDDVLVIDGGVVSLPEPVSLGWNFGFEPGLAYACMAETITLAFEGHRGHYSVGRNLTLAQVEDITGRAAGHGFALSGLRSFGRPITRAHLDRVRARAGR